MSRNGGRFHPPWRAVGFALITLAACSSAGAPTASDSPAAPIALRLINEAEVPGLLLQDGDIPGAKADRDEGPAGPTEELSDAEWREHLDDHGLTGRWWSSIVTGEDAPLGYPFIIGGRVSLWADAQAAGEALAFENGRQPPGTRILAVHEASELGDDAWCGVLDWGDLADRMWCRFAVSNATFDLYIRTGDQTHPGLDPRATQDLPALAIRVRHRVETLATADR